MKAIGHVWVTTVAGCEAKKQVIAVFLRAYLLEESAIRAVKTDQVTMNCQGQVRGSTFENH